MARYELCPRCQLNFIDADKEDFCEVCRMELNGEKTFTDNLDDADIEETELCPICGENYMRAGEKMCDECKKKSDYEEDIEEEEEEDPDKDDAWRSYLDDDDAGEDIGIDLSGEELDDEDEEEEEEEEETSETDDDFEYVSADDYLDDEGDEDEDDDEDDSFDDDDAPSLKSGASKKRRRNDDDDF